jgi:hypothetical protein
MCLNLCFFQDFDVPLPTILDGSGGVQTEPTTYTFQGKYAISSFKMPSCSHVTFAGEDWPLILYRLTGGTPSINIDLVSANTTINSTKVTRSLSEEHSSDIRARLVTIRKDAETGKKETFSPSIPKRTVEKRGLLDLILSYLFPKPKPGTFEKFPIVGEIAQYDWVSRNSNGAYESNGYSTIAVSKFLA